MEIQTTIFDYDSLAIETREFVKAKEISIKARTSQTIWENGRDLLEVKERLEHGQFQKWVEANFPWSYRTVKGMMQVARNLKGEESALFNFSNETLYLLAQNSTPESARTEAIEKAESGETITHKEAKELVQAHKTISDLETKIQSLQSKLPTEDVLNKISILENQLKEAKNKPARDPQMEADLIQAQTRARTLEEALIEAENKPAQLVERVVKVKDGEALAKLQREKNTYQEKANAMTHELANYERRIKELQSQIEVDNPVNIDFATANAIRPKLRIIEMDVHGVVEDALRIGGVLDETKAVLSAMIDSLQRTYHLADSLKVIDI